MLRAMIAAAVVLLTPLAAAAQENGGLHTEDWFAVTFKDIREDMQTAHDQGKRLALIVEQTGCIYCKKLHEQVLSDPEVRDYIKANYMVVQYNMFGDEEVTDLDGKVMTEKQAARRWRLVFTPTILFMPDKIPQGEDAAQAAVEIMPGAFGKWTVIDMFTWVRNKGYEGTEMFQKYHARHIDQLRAEGRL